MPTAEEIFQRLKLEASLSEVREVASMRARNEVAKLEREEAADALKCRAAAHAAQLSHLKPTDIANMLAEILSGAVGGTHAKWLELIGPVEALPIWTAVQSNWRVSPVAIGAELDAIVKAAELLRAEHPYVVP